MQRIFGWAEQGGQYVLVQGIPSQNNTQIQRSYPGATVQVFDAGTNNAANIYSDNNGTVLANPFTASISGYWDFYAAAGRYDVRFSGANSGILAPFTIPDISVFTDADAIQIGANGNNFNVVTANGVSTLNLPTASNNNRGALSPGDWATFNAKQNAITFVAPLSNNNNNVALATPLAITYGGSNANNKTAAFNNLSPQNTKGDLIVFDGNNAVRVGVNNNNNYVLVSDSNNGSGVKWALVPVASANGILPIANGGSNANTAVVAFTNLSPITTKGDLIVGNNTAIPVRLGAGANNQTIIADSNNTSGMAWGNMNLAGTGVTGTLPSSKGGTGGNNNAQGFDLLSPMTANGDLITRAANTGSRLAVGNNNDVLTCNNNALVYVQPAALSAKYTVAFNNNAFIVNALALDITLFTLGQYQKIAGVTVKPSVLYLNPANSITDVTLSLGIAGNNNLYTAAYSVGNNGAVGNSNFQDTSLFKSGNMGGATPVLAHFIATGNNFGNGVATVLLSGSVDIWVHLVNVQ